MIVGTLLLTVFVVAAVLMFFRKLPAMLALPLMAVAITLIEVARGDLTFNDLAVAVVADGSLRLADAMVISMFGGMISLLMQKTGVAQSLVRTGAELAGDNPLVVSLVMLAIAVILFTTIGGLGAVIMVGTVVLPILASMGVREHISAGILLFGISLGGALNPTNWVVYRTVIGLEGEIVSSFALVLFLMVGLAAIGFVGVELWRTRALKLKARMLVRVGVVFVTLCAASGLIIWLFGQVPSRDLGEIIQWVVGSALGFIVLLAVFDAVRAPKMDSGASVRWYAYLIPLVPLLLILVFGMAYVPAFLLGLLFSVVVTLRRGMINLTSRSIIEGSASVIPAIVLMVGIGMLLNAILGPTRIGPGKYWYDLGALQGTAAEWPVLRDMKPILQLIVPHSFTSFVFTFSLLGPLALYRGPLNVWGLGYGIGGVLLATGLPPGAVMGALMSLGMIQGVSDPTNTANVWIANEVRLDVTTLMWRTLPYAWVAAILGLLAAGLRFMP